MLCDVFEATTTDFKVPSITQTFTSVLQFFFMSVSDSKVKGFLPTAFRYFQRFGSKVSSTSYFWLQINEAYVVCRTVGQKHQIQTQTLWMLSQSNWWYPQQRYVLQIVRVSKNQFFLLQQMEVHFFITRSSYMLSWTIFITVCLRLGYPWHIIFTTLTRRTPI